MASWDCDFFRKDSLFGQAEINAQYAGGGGSPFVGFRSDWLGAERKSGAKDADAPKVAPFYWGIKDVQYSDAQRSKTWKKAMLKKVQEHVKLPPFMDPGNLRHFHTSPEFWFAASGAGAKAHMDTHVQSMLRSHDEMPYDAQHMLACSPPIGSPRRPSRFSSQERSAGGWP